MRLAIVSVIALMLTGASGAAHASTIDFSDLTSGYCNYLGLPP